MVKFEMTKGYEAYNNSQNADDSIIGLETMVQFFISSKEIVENNEDSTMNEVTNLGLSEP